MPPVITTVQTITPGSPAAYVFLVLAALGVVTGVVTVLTINRRRQRESQSRQHGQGPTTGADGNER